MVRCPQWLHLLLIVAPVRYETVAVPAVMVDVVSPVLLIGQHNASKCRQEQCSSTNTRVRKLLVLWHCVVEAVALRQNAMVLTVLLLTASSLPVSLPASCKMDSPPRRIDRPVNLMVSRCRSRRALVWSNELVTLEGQLVAGRLPQSLLFVRE